MAVSVLSKIGTVGKMYIVSVVYNYLKYYNLANIKY